MLRGGEGGEMAESCDGGGGSGVEHSGMGRDLRVWDDLVRSGSVLRWLDVGEDGRVLEGSFIHYCCRKASAKIYALARLTTL